MTERQEETMELKPIAEMEIEDVCNETRLRLGIPGGPVWFDRAVLDALRAQDIGTSNLNPPEPEWKRERVWPDEVPVEKGHVELDVAGDYYPAIFVDNRFCILDGSTVHGMAKRKWRYLTEPLTWKNVERDGNPSEGGWYWGRCHFAEIVYWDGEYWRFSKHGAVRIHWVTDYCPIAPAPPYEEESQ